MAAKIFSERNLKFLIYDVFDVESLTHHDYYRSHNRKAFDLIFQAAIRLARNLLYPIFTEMDRAQPEFVQGEVKVHPSVRKIMKEFGNGGWITSRVPFDKDGEQLPHLIADACDFIFQASNYSASVFPGLTSGAAHLIETFGSPDLYERFVPNLYTGKWQGTMALTEPEAGSSLSDIATTAEPTDREYYLLKGQKIFISAGDHDGVDNVVHLLLAKIKGAPPGVRGISLFVVPKYRFKETDRLASNDVNTSGIYHKLGYRGCPIVQLSLGDKDDCRGWIVGEPHNGLKYMFQMMNEFRIGVGLGASAMATAAYYESLEYAKTRHQGRKPSQRKPETPPIPIIEHSDIKRMLLFQKSIIEGSLSLLLQCSRYVDLQKTCTEKDREKYHLLLEILTPVAKSYPSEMGIQSISQGLQIFGGSGYCDDYPLEQYYRDARIHPIHEGTTGIHGLDLLGRKVRMLNGKAFELLIREIEATISDAKCFHTLEGFADKLDKTIQMLTTVTHSLMEVAHIKGPEYFLADATLYLELFGITAVAWQWLIQGISVQKALDRQSVESDVDFYTGKMFTLRYFFGYELPKSVPLAKRLLENDGLTVEIETKHFQ